MSSKLQNSKNLTIIDPGARVAEVECFNDIAEIFGGPCSYHLPAIVGTRSLSQVGETSGIIILGSSTSVHDKLKWQDELREWLESQFKKRIPILGLCYGHQLIAQMFGAEVDFVSSNKKKLEGTRLTNVKASLEPTDRSGKLVVTHREKVCDLPNNFELVASSSEIAVDGFAHRSLPIWGFQAHLEANSAFIQNNVGVDVKDEDFQFGKSLLTKWINAAKAGDL